MSISKFNYLVHLGIKCAVIVENCTCNDKNTLDNSPITPGQVTFFRVLTATIFLFLISIFNNGSDSVIEGLFNDSFQVYAIIIGVVFYLELVNWFYDVNHVDVSVASSIKTPTPVVTMILAVLLLGESIEIYQLITLVLVFISLYGLLYYGKKTKKYPEGSNS